MAQAAILAFLKHIGPRMRPIEVKKTLLPDGTVILRGRVRRPCAGEIRVDFGHRFSDPENVVVLVNGNFNQQVGFIETVTEVNEDHFIVTSYNAHETLSFISWIAYGGFGLGWTAVGN